RVLAGLHARTTRPAASPEEEAATVIVRPEQAEQITANGAIQVQAASADHLLIIADVLAKSVALARNEREIAAVIDAFEPFARTLAAKGQPGSRRGVILRLIGQALLLQHSVTGSVAVREKPDILWDRPDLERLYSRLEDEYELVERADNMDRRLAVIDSTATALINLKDASRSLRLELIIIVLILAELIVGLLTFFASGLR
ncbi:MAG: RMD1 family protein, partial [Verrucomicrobia bacterium]